MGPQTASRSRVTDLDGRILNQPALLDRRADEACKQRVRLERARFQFGMILDADEPGMVRALDDLGKQPVGRHAGENETFFSALM